MFTELFQINFESEITPVVLLNWLLVILISINLERKYPGTILKSKLVKWVLFLILLGCLSFVYEALVIVEDINLLTIFFLFIDTIIFFGFFITGIICLLLNTFFIQIVISIIMGIKARKAKGKEIKIIVILFLINLLALVISLSSSSIFYSAFLVVNLILGYEDRVEFRNHIQRAREKNKSKRENLVMTRILTLLNLDYILVFSMIVSVLSYNMVIGSSGWVGVFLSLLLGYGMIKIFLEEMTKNKRK
jgi:hypothetical protein